MRPINFEALRTYLSELPSDVALRRMQDLQVVVYVMCEGGMLGKLAAEQPRDFYIDTRVGRRPYSRKAIAQAVAVLIAHADRVGFRKDLPAMPDFHGCGIF